MGEAELRALLQTISTLCPKGDLIIDDRPRLTIGRKLLDLRRLGVPFVVVPKVKVSVSYTFSIDVIIAPLRCSPIS